MELVISVSSERALVWAGLRGILGESVMFETEFGEVVVFEMEFNDALVLEMASSDVLMLEVGREEGLD